MSKIKEMLSWVYSIVKFPLKDREELYNLSMESIKYDTKTADLYKMLKDKKQYEFVGITPNISYVSMDKSYTKKELECLWVHPFSRPTLLFYNKRYHYYMLINANLRKDKSVLKEISKNLNINQLSSFLGTRGITG